MTLHGSRIAWNLSILTALVCASGCGGTKPPCTRPHRDADHGRVYDVAPAPDSVPINRDGLDGAIGNLSLTYQTQGGLNVTTAVPLQKPGVNIVGSQILHVPMAGFNAPKLAFSIPSAFAAEGVLDFDINLLLPGGVHGSVGHSSVTVAGVDSQLTYEATLVPPESGLIEGTPGVHMQIELKKSDGSVLEILVQIDLDDQNCGKAGS